MKKILIPFLALFFLFACKTIQKRNSHASVPFDWKAANLYFLMTDRFYNGNPGNDRLINRNEPTGVLRGFMGGDIKGITQKIEEGYFTNLGINAIWFTPVVEQIHGSVDEGTGNSYGFHGYWAKDWTNLDPNFGTKEELRELVEKAHARGIRIVLDAVINHTGPVTPLDPVYPNDWVRRGPRCLYNSYKTYVECTLVDNLPDVLTESTQEVDLPPALVEKWKKEGRYEKEVASLDSFFRVTGYPRAPKYYIMKWLADYILEFGIDGYRVDTAKHTDADVWFDFNAVCQAAFAAYKKKFPAKALDGNPFFMLGEVYNYGIGGGLTLDFGDRKVNYFENGLEALINFDFKSDAHKSYEELFSYYSRVMHNELRQYNIANYLSSHDDGHPFDQLRQRSFEGANKLLLAPGISQIYYGDETNRPLRIEGAKGDATLRSFMNWSDIATSAATKSILAHYQKLGQFRSKHPSVGAGKHQMLSATPYVFERSYSNNRYADYVVIALDLPKGAKTIPVGNRFKEGATLLDSYSGKKVQVKNGGITIDTPYDVLLLEETTAG